MQVLPDGNASAVSGLDIERHSSSCCVCVTVGCEETSTDGNICDPEAGSVCRSEL